MSNIYLKVTIETFLKLLFSRLKKFVTRSVFQELQLWQISLNFETSFCNLKIRGLAAKLYVALYFNFERIYNVLKSKSPCILLNKNINLKSETESKMEKPTHSFRETDIVLQFIQESQIKSKTVMSWSSRKKKGHFLYRLFCPKGIF